MTFPLSSPIIRGLSDKLKILVLGDACEDVTKFCSAARLAPDHPVPVVKVLSEVSAPGMAANVAAIYENLGAEVTLISNTVPIKKIRYVHKETGHHFIRIDEEPLLQPLSIEYLITYLEIHNLKIEEFDICALIDYNKNFLTEEVMEYVFDRAAFSIVDSKKIFGNWAQNASFIKINSKEYDYNILKSNYLLKDSVKPHLIVTKGSEGILFNNNLYAAPKIQVASPCGCGDVVTCVLSKTYKETNSISAAITQSNLYAAYACSLPGVTSSFPATLQIKKELGLA